MCCQAVEQSRALCQSNSSPFVAASRLYPGARDDFMEKKQRLATDNISFALSCELPALCERAAEKHWREGIPPPLFFPPSFWGLPAKGLSCAFSQVKAVEK